LRRTVRDSSTSTSTRLLKSDTVSLPLLTSTLTSCAYPFSIDVAPTDSIDSYDPVGETLNITRTKSSLIKSYGNDTESARLKLFNFAGVKTKMLSLTIIVDNSVLEVFANDEAVITTRIYPWLSASVGAGVLGVAGTGSPVKVYNQELWDGLREFKSSLLHSIIDVSCSQRVPCEKGEQ
jgi:sucrose-6-phosphate hydrolase SacC (GH32 family)